MRAHRASQGVEAQPRAGGAEAAPTVAVSDRQRRPLPPMTADALAALAASVLSGEVAGGGELTLSFVDPEEMEDLHLRYMTESGPTDVLSFPMHDEGLLGDVVVCPAVAASNRPDDVDAELRLLVVHGVLHVLGHDHGEEDARAAMWALQARYSGTSLP